MSGLGFGVGAVTAMRTGQPYPLGWTTEADPARIILGGRFGEEPSTLSWRRLDRFAELGGRIVETAHCYADGRSEQVIGEWLRANPGQLVVVDKIGHPDGDQVPDLSPARLRREAEQSCRRLGVTSIDVLLLHRDAPMAPVAEVADTLVGLMADNMARQIGVSNWPAERLRQLVEALVRYGHQPVVSYQMSLAVPVAPLWPGALHADAGVRRVVADHNLQMLAWAAQARGFFTGTTEPASPGQPNPFDSLENVRRRDRCRELAGTIGARPETVALAWLLRHPNTRAIVGPRSIAELDASLAAVDVHLDAAIAEWLCD